MATFPAPITRIGGGGYFTDVDAWGRTVASNLPPTHVLHHELEQLNQQVEVLQSDKDDLIDANGTLKRKIGELRTRLRTEMPADIHPSHTSLYQKIDSAISTADANLLRAILREVCRESEKAATIAASILPSPPAVEDRSNTTRAPSSTRTTSSRRTSVRFQDPPVSTNSDRTTSTRRSSVRFQDAPVPVDADRTADDAEEHARQRRRGRAADAEKHTGNQDAFSTPRRAKRRAEDVEEEEQGSRKRRSTAPLTCAACKREYNPDENEKGHCKRHPGYKKVDPSLDGFWCDWDERVHGRCEAYIDDPKYAEGFVWSCCGEFADVKRCPASKHLTNDELKAKRSRIIRPFAN
ncbi:hypothetical protein EG329_001394 [Mollisiaceae sp. DMI_Dod_QoI]|nr:hypothetical protein EG329_001394 [Helotiales sp. DMI_Dod_QoI]